MVELKEFVARNAVPFAWGSADCATLACDWVRARTGNDPLTRWRGEYCTALGAARIIAQYGTFRDWCFEAFARLPVMQLARTGDIVLSADDDPALCIVMGVHTLRLVSLAGSTETHSLMCVGRTKKGLGMRVVEPAVIWRVP